MNKTNNQDGWVLVSLSLSMLLASLGTSIANVALPTLVEVFKVSFQEVQWVVLAYLLATTTLIVSVGRLGDIVGHRRLLLVGICLFTVASVCCSLAPVLSLLITARALQGLGAAIMLSLTLAFVSDTVPKEKIGTAMGVLGMMSAIGTALGPSLGGLLISVFGWRAIFLIVAMLGILTFVLVYRYLSVHQIKQNAKRISFDYIGTLILVLTLAAYALAMTIGRGHFSAVNVLLLVIAVAGAGLFVFVQAKVAAPLIQLAVFSNAVLSVGFATSGLVSTVMMATLVVAPFYLSQALGLNAVLVGVLMSIGPLVVALTGVPAGRLTDKFGTQLITMLGLIAIAVGSFILSIIPLKAGIPGYIVSIIIITFGYGLFQTANNTAVMRDVRPDQRGVISGILNLSRNLGLITGASLMGAVFSFASGTSKITTAHPEAVAVGMQATFVLAGFLILFAIAIVSFTGRTRTAS